MPTFRQFTHLHAIEVAIVVAILIILGALVALRLGGPAYPRCRDLAGDSLSRYEECVRQEQMAE